LLFFILFLKEQIKDIIIPSYSVRVELDGVPRAIERWKPRRAASNVAARALFFSRELRAWRV
jgi:hypothetical protein